MYIDVGLANKISTLFIEMNESGSLEKLLESLINKTMYYSIVLLFVLLLPVKRGFKKLSTLDK